MKTVRLNREDETGSVLNWVLKKVTNPEFLYRMLGMVVRWSKSFPLLRVKTTFLVPPRGSISCLTLSVLAPPEIHIHQGALCFVAVSKRSQSGTATSKMNWEPLTLESLLEEKPTRIAPGEKDFRFGRAQHWFIKNTTAIK